MNTRILRICTLAALFGGSALAQDITGDWRGTLKPGPVELRLGLHITKAEDGFKGSLDSIDQGAKGIPVTSVTIKGSDVTFAVDAVHGTYEGKISADGASIKGTWTQGQPLPLDFERGAFKIPEHRPAKPSDIDGTWSGTLDLGQATLRIVFHIVNTEDGLTATADSPDQNAKGAPVREVTRDGSSLKFDMKAQAAAFEGKISGDLGTITGTFTQMGKDTPLVLTRVKGE